MAVPIVVEFLAGTAGLSAGLGKVSSELGALKLSSEATMANVGKAGVAVSGLIVVAAGAIAVASLKMAGDFESAIVHLTTDAGEAKSNMQMISDGILSIAQETGSGTKDLVNAMYYIESAGIHGAEALDTLHAAAEGAKVGNADLTTVAQALTTVLVAYPGSAGTATQATDGMIYAVSQGKTKLEDFANAMATLLPAGAAAKIPLSELEGALSTMTAQGQDAASGATHLRQTILQLANPTAKARDEMKSLGLNAFDVSNNLGARGLTGTFDILTKAIADHTQGGAVLIESLKSASKNTTAYEQVLANLNPEQQTTIAALADMTGGTKSLQAVLQLTGDQAEKFKQTSLGVAEAMKSTGSDVNDWDVIQGTFNQHMSELRATIEVLAIKIGTALLPAVTKIADAFGVFLNFVADHTWALAALAAIIGGALIVSIAALGVALWSLASNPVFLIIAAIIAVVALLGVGIYELYTHWDEVFGYIKDKTRSVADFFANAWNTAFENVRNAVNTVSGFFVTTWNTAYEAVRSALTSVASFFVGVWNTIVSATMTAVHTVVDPIVTAWNAIWDTTSKVFGAIASFFGTWWPLLLAVFETPIFLLLAAWHRWHEDVESTVHTVWDRITDFFITVFDVIKTMMSSVASFISGVWNTVADFLTKVYGSIQDVAVSVWSSIYETISGYVRSVADFITSVWNTIYGFLARIMSSIMTFVSDKWNSFVSIVKSALDMTLQATQSAGHVLYAAIIQPIEDAYNWVVGMIGKFFDIGSSIVNGIADGIKNAAGAVLGAIGNVLTGANSSAKKAIDSNSPSRLFARTIGSPISEGIAMGIMNSGHMIDTALGSVTQPQNFDMGGSFTSGGGPAGTFGAGNVGGSSNSGATININLTGPVYGGPAGLQEFAVLIRTELQRTGLRIGSVGLG